MIARMGSRKNRTEILQIDIINVSNGEDDVNTKFHDPKLLVDDNGSYCGKGRRCFIGRGQTTGCLLSTSSAKPPYLRRSSTVVIMPSTVPLSCAT
jgi:hypothetical protein